jgi:hypothetical protein
MKADLVTQKIRAEDELKKANKIICDDISTLKILENSEYIVVEYQKTNESQITKYDTIKFDATNYLEFKRSIIHENEKYNLKSIDFYYKLNLNLRSEYYISNFTLVLPTKEKEEVPVYVPYLADYGRQNAKIPIDPTSKKIEGRYTLKTQFRTNNQKCNNNSNNVEAIYSIVIK